jgi:hypothetical protein
MARLRGIFFTLRAALVAAALASAASAQAADPPRAGHIDNFEGPPGSFVLLRGPADAPRKMPVERYMKLFAGDEIRIEDSAARMWVVLGDGQVRELPEAADRLSFKVPAGGSVPTVVDNLLGWATGWMTRLFETNPAPQRANAAIRGGASDKPAGPLAAPLVTGPGAHAVRAGTTIFLGWSGGEAPYQMRILSANRDRVLLRDDALDLPQGRIPGERLAPGAYIVDIQDFLGTRIEGKFQVLARNASVPTLADLEGSQLPAPTRATLGAIWLASQDNGAWTLEAYQSVAILPEEYTPARLVRDALAAGTPLPKQ